MITITKSKLSGKKRKTYMKIVKTVKDDLLASAKDMSKPMKLEKFESTYKIQ